MSRSLLAHLHVLFVDDSSDERELFAVRFGADCTRLVTVASAKEALEEVCREPVDLVVSDLSLQDCNGCELVHRIRNLPGALAGIPAIVVTGWTDARCRDEVRAAGFSSYLAKPYTSEQFLEAVRSLVGQHAAT